MKNQEEILLQALEGNINAFQMIFSEFQQPLKSYLYRLLANRNDTEDLTHDTFIKAFDNLSSFKGGSSLKTWVFQIATNLSYNYLNRQKRWQIDVMQKGKQLAMTESSVFEKIIKVSQTATDVTYDMKEHIDTCFTCISKTLPIENQITLLLKDVYDFSVTEICLIVDKSEGVVKHLLLNARKTLTDIFESRCALVNKNGVCNQCSELNGLFNPKQNRQEELMKLNFMKGSTKHNREKLFDLRLTLVKAIDPLRSEGADLQEVLLKCNRMAAGEIDSLN
jgi:RNA polymerase sigma-70 factor, ECF subfamily